MNVITPRGLGMFVWILNRNSHPQNKPRTIVENAAQAGLGHLIVKLLDGQNPSQSSADLQEFLAACQDLDVQPWAYQYTYGFNPAKEGQLFAQALKAGNFMGGVVNAEHQYKQTGGAQKATSYMAALRPALPADYPLALSTYRYPNYHREFPYSQFLQTSGGCNILAPQVYWEQAHNPAQQLTWSHDQWRALPGAAGKPFVPTGSAYTVNGWTPTTADIVQFCQAAEDLAPAANFWEYHHARILVPALWSAIASQTPNWTPPPPPPPTAGQVVLIPEASALLAIYDRPHPQQPGTVAAKIGPNTPCWLLGLQQVWAQVQVVEQPEIVGWAHARYLQNYTGGTP